MIKTIFSDGKSLEIERVLKITVYLPQLCHFCTKEITTFESHKADSLVFHSLDGNHNNWNPENKVPAHLHCHMSFHNKGKPHPWMVGNKNPMFGKIGDKNIMANSEVKAKHLKSMGTPERQANLSERWMDDKNPMKNPDIAKKVWVARRKNHGPTGLKPLTPEEKEKDHQRRSEATTRGVQTRRERGSKPNDNKKAWDTRRRLYPPNGMKPKEEK